MTAGWVAGSVRASAMARRRLGTVQVRAVATSPGLAAAVETVARSPYGPAVQADQSLAEAQRAVAGTVLWNLRVLAGWLPPDGAEMLRLLAGWFEIANVDEHLRQLAGGPADPPFRLGTLATAWPRLATTASTEELRSVLASSAWGDPGGTAVRTLQLALRVSWASRLAARVEPAQPWASGALALLAARELFVAARPLPAALGPAMSRMLGVGWSGAASMADLASRLPTPARWALRGVADPADLWRAEMGWWSRVHADGHALLAKPGFGPHRAIGAVALLGADAWRTRAALDVAARGGRALEVLDAVA